MDRVAVDRAVVAEGAVGDGPASPTVGLLRLLRADLRSKRARDRQTEAGMDGARERQGVPAVGTKSNGWAWWMKKRQAVGESAAQRVTWSAFAGT